jgi:hypothetical protein
VRIVEKRGGVRRIVEHVGSAHTAAELAVLMQTARDRLHAGQQVLDLDLGPGVDVDTANPETGSSGRSLAGAVVVGTASQVLWDVAITDRERSRPRRVMTAAAPAPPPFVIRALTHHTHNVWPSVPPHRHVNVGLSRRNVAHDPSRVMGNGRSWQGERSQASGSIGRGGHLQIRSDLDIPPDPVVHGGVTVLYIVSVAAHCHRKINCPPTGKSRCPLTIFEPSTPLKS